MTTKTRTQDQLEQLEPETVQAIRESYYKAAEGLSALRELVRGSVMVEQHMHVRRALEDFDKVDFGKYL